MVLQDGNKNDFVQVNPWFRVTVVNYEGDEQYRFNTVNADGKVLMGPQLSMDDTDKLLDALEELAKKRVVI